MDIVKLIKSVFKYAISLGIAGGLLWLTFKDRDLGEMLEKLQSANYWWVGLSLLLAVIAHVARAYRWVILFEPLGYKLGFMHSLYAVFIGYFANIPLPRLGEVAKCAILKRTDDIKMSVSIGTVVSERIFDTVILLAVIILGFIFQFDELLSVVVNTLPDGQVVSTGTNWALVIGLLTLPIIVLLAFYKSILKFLQRSIFYTKIRGFVLSLVEGMLSIRKIKRKTGFWISTAVIWIAYFFMTYVVFFAIPETENLSMFVALSVLVMGSVGMVIPAPGGIGSYHFFVSETLLLYGIAKPDGVLLATLIHTASMLMIIVFGLISLVLALMIANRNKKPDISVHEQ